jgi:hypothetical protein
MSETELKPLKWKPDPNIGYTVSRRPDGGMNFTFTSISPDTVAHWRAFALEHLLDSDRLTRNLYDLSHLTELPPEALQAAIEVNTDPSVRNIRLAVVAVDEKVKQALRQVASLTPGGVEMGLFPTIAEAEAWLNRPLTQLV